MKHTISKSVRSVTKFSNMVHPDTGMTADGQRNIQERKGKSKSMKVKPKVLSWC